MNGAVIIPARFESSRFPGKPLIDIHGKPIQYVTTENFLQYFNIQKLSDLPTIDELSSAGLIDSQSIDSSIFGTGKFFKEQSQAKKDNIYSNIDEVIKQSSEKEE